MPCITCVSWRRSGKPGDAHVGRCERDNAPAHSNYHCWQHKSKQSERHLGLTHDEVTWLQGHPTYPAAAGLIRLYRMVVDAPNDPGARGIFAAALADWRERNKSGRR